MPTVAPVPATFTALSHSAQVLYLYRHILRESARFFDERASQWARSRAHETFAKNKSQRSAVRVQKNMADARRALRLLERANQMDIKAVQRVLRSAYGLQGVERRRLMQPLVDSARVRTSSPARLATSLSGMGSHVPTNTTAAAGQVSSSSLSSTSSILQSDHLSTEQLARILTESIQQPKPLFYQKQRTIPPIYSEPVAALIRNTTGKSIEPTLPEPLSKPLHGKREANLRWRFFSKQINRLKPPLQAQIRQEMEWKSRIGLNHPSSLMNSGSQDTTAVLPHVGRFALAPNRVSMTEDSLSTAFMKWEERILQTIRAWNKNGQEQKAKRFETGRFHPSIGGKPAKSNIMTPRLYRRLWRQLLDEVPVLDIQVAEDQAKAMASKEERNSSSSNLAISISKSPESHQLRATAGLRDLAVVNEFDRIGMVEGAEVPPGLNKKTRKNKGV